MARHKHHNPEKRSWRGRSYRQGGKRVRQLRESLASFLADDEAGQQVCCFRKLL